MAEKKRTTVPANERAEPMTFQRFRTRSLLAYQISAAGEAESMSATELRETAERLQVDTTGARTKDELVEAVRSAPRAVATETES